MAWPTTRLANGPPPVDYTEWNGILTLAARKDAPNAFTSYQDLLALDPASVPTPPAGRRRLFVSTVDNKVYAKTSAGVLVSLEEAGGVGGGDVSSVFGRTGAVVAIGGDYSLSLLDDVDDVSAPSNGQVLRYNGTSGLWEAGSATGIVATKYTYTWEDFVAASPDPPNAGGSSIEMFQLGQLEKVVGITVKHSEAFVGAPITTATIGLIFDFGGGEPLMPVFDAGTAVADENKLDRNTWYSPNHSATASQRALFVQLLVAGTGSGRLSHLTAGSVDIWIATFTLPS